MSNGVNHLPSGAGVKLWSHPDPKSTQMHRFGLHLELAYPYLARNLSSYEALHTWSITHLPEFWAAVWEYTGVRASEPFQTVVDPEAPMFPRPPWFEGAKLNFAENLLFPASVGSERDGDVAVVAATEDGGRERTSWRELRERVRACAAAMAGMVKVGDRVVGYVGNHTEALIAMLATTSLGGIWSGISPDHGTTAVLNRWSQLEPVLLFADSAVFYNGRAHSSLIKLREIVVGLPTLRDVVVVPKFLVPTDTPDLSWVSYTDFLLGAKDPARPLQFEQLDPDAPVYILFSSGTTGKPKCICHGAIGTLIQHKKELQLHCDIGPGSVFFQFTTVTWMMWHWLVSGLASGATIVLYDGSPFKPVGNLSMASLIEEFGVTHFGTSAKYLSMLEQSAAFPKKVGYSLSSLHAIYSTAAPLPPSTFSYVYDAFGPNILLGSITGGTDIISLFGAPSALLPVHAGEIQCLGLGMAVAAWDSGSTSPTPVPAGQPGDLVATHPFPCQPVCFWGDNKSHDLYRNAYFTNYATTSPVWHHGDFILFSPQTGGLTMLGRSDGVLKPAGVRFGSAEIYNVLVKHFPTKIADALCVGRRRDADADEDVVLFCLMMPSSSSEGGEGMTDALRTCIRTKIRDELSARHVPKFVEACPEIPITTNGKKVEVAVKGIVSGHDGEGVKVGASVANPGCLEWFREWSRNN